MSVVVNHAFPNWNTPLPWGGFPTIFRHALISYDWFTVGHISHIICQYSHTHTLYIYVYTLQQHHIHWSNLHVDALNALLKAPGHPFVISTTHQMRLSQLHAGHSGLAQPGCQGQVRTSSGEIIYICIVYDPYILIYSIRIMTIKMILMIYIYIEYIMIIVV